MVNLLTARSFERRRTFSRPYMERSRTCGSGAPVSSDGNWTARGAVNQADISSWIVAGSYTTHSPAARHQYDIGMSYSTQRYDGGNLLTLRDVSENSRNVGTVYGYDTFKVTPMLAVEYGGAYGRYLKDRGLISPRVESYTADQFRIRSSFRGVRLRPGRKNSSLPAIPASGCPNGPSHRSTRAAGSAPKKHAGRRVRRARLWCVDRVAAGVPAAC